MFQDTKVFFCYSDKLFENAIAFNIFADAVVVVSRHYNIVHMQPVRSLVCCFFGFRHFCFISLIFLPHAWLGY